MLSFLGIALVLPSLGASNPREGATARSRPDHRPERTRTEPEPACPLCRLIRQHGLDVAPLVQRHVYRCAPHLPPAVALFPTGAVRREDLATYTVEVHDEFEDGWIDWARGDEVVHSGPLEPEDSAAPLPMPVGVLDSVVEDLNVPFTWRVYGKTGRCLCQSTFRLARLWPDEEERLRRIEASVSDLPAFEKRLVRAEALLGLRLDLAARTEARAALRIRAEEPHALAVLEHALLRLGAIDSSEEDETRWMARGAAEQRRLAGVRCRVDDVVDEAVVLRDAVEARRWGCGSR